MQESESKPKEFQVFLSYSRNELDDARRLRSLLVGAGLSVFMDEQSIELGDLWLDEIQQAVVACDSFVVPVGRDGMQRWVGAETQAALIRHFNPKKDADNPKEDARRLREVPERPGHQDQRGRQGSLEVIGRVG